MQTAVKLVAAGLICCVLCLLLKKQAPEFALGLCVLVCALFFLAALPFLSSLLSFLQRLETLTGLSDAIFSPLFKTVAIGLLSQMTASVCRDAGQQALGQAVELCSGMLCLYLALPLLESVLSLLQSMIGG